MKAILSVFASERSGATAIEYGALVMFVGLALVLVLESVGLSVEGAFTQLKTIFGSAASG